MDVNEVRLEEITTLEQLKKLYTDIAIMWPPHSTSSVEKLRGLVAYVVEPPSKTGYYIWGGVLNDLLHLNDKGGVKFDRSDLILGIADPRHGPKSYLRYAGHNGKQYIDALCIMGTDGNDYYHPFKNIE